jgi:pimeloyl-ACP methyl ester carboxylesterase
MKSYATQRVALRGLAHNVLTWGAADAPKLFLLHGWMDVAASFQFLVDAFTGSWHVIAPDLRGFGRSEWQSQGYWFADYVADLEALLDVFAPGGQVDLIGHSLGGNVAMQYAGVRPQRVRALVSLDGFGIPAERSGSAPEKYAAWLDALRDPPEFAPYANLEAVADRLQKNNRRLAREQAEFLARHWAEVTPDGRARLVSDPRHKLPFPLVYRMEETYAIWRSIAAPTLWVAAADSNIPRWLDDHPEGEGGADSHAGIRRRLAHIPDGRLEIIADAGHMLHHDQPAAVAAAIETFLVGVAKAAG